ncbi:rod-binding protein [Novosphingobium sp. YJ-S2-02]|uniref:Rod-binding protein n=1 Tax=Novosphingobium aureum TaxID=2792964 RepID=A0A931MK49_9SPHN|nr:rod-binding protein [Novosphingobium aureum]MBH0112135.1 rod-binding protein [Novosphingobium aureum]
MSLAPLSPASVPAALALAPGSGMTSPQATEGMQLHAAAQQFEAIFVRQMLAAARQTSFAPEGPFSGQAIETFRQMRDEQFADVAARSGAFGLASAIEAQLARFVPASEQKEG